MKPPPGTPRSFEETYPRYPFSVLVGIGVEIARLLTRLRSRRGAGRRYAEAESTARAGGRRPGPSAAASRTRLPFGPRGIPSR